MTDFVSNFVRLSKTNSQMFSLLCSWLPAVAQSRGMVRYFYSCTAQSLQTTVQYLVIFKSFGLQFSRISVAILEFSRISGIALQLWSMLSNLARNRPE